MVTLLEDKETPRPPVDRQLHRSRRAVRKAVAMPGFLSMSLVALVTGFLVLYPLGMLVYGSLRTSRPGLPGSFTVQNYVTAYTDPGTYHVLLNTVVVIGTQALIGTILAVALAWIVTRTDTPGRRVLEILIIVPFFIPGILETVGWIMLLSPRKGTLNVLVTNLFGLSDSPFTIYSLPGMIWVMSLSSTSFVFLLVVSALRGMDSSLEEAARSSGAGPLRVAFTVTLPLMTPALFGATMLNFIRSLDSFEIPVLLGTPADIYLFTNRIYAAVEQDYPINYGLATALGVTFTILALALILIQRRLTSGKEFFVVTGKAYKPQVQKLGRFRWVTFAVALGYFLVATALPMSQIVVGSVSRVFGLWEPERFTLKHYSALISDERLWRALLNTLVICGLAATITAALCAAVAYIVTRTGYPGRTLLDTAAWLPYTVPGVVVGLGMLWAYIALPLPFPLYGSLALLVIAFITAGLPIGVRLMAGGLTQLSKELEQSSRVHGASWLYTFRRIVLPLLKPTLAAAILVLFVIFSRSVSSVILLTTADTELVSVVMFEKTLDGQMETVSALAMVLLAINATGLILAKLLGAFDVKDV